MKIILAEYDDSNYLENYLENRHTAARLFAV